MLLLIVCEADTFVNKYFFTSLLVLFFTTTTCGRCCLSPNVSHQLSAKHIISETENS